MLNGDATLADRVTTGSPALGPDVIYQRLVERSSDIPYVTDINGTVTFIGHQVEVYGYIAEKLVGRNLVELVYPEDLGKVMNDFQQAVECGVESVTTFRVNTPTMGVRYFEDNGSILRDQDGRILGTSGFLRDITQRRQTEEALKQARDGLEKRVKERTAKLAAANEQLKQEIAQRHRVEQALRESEERFRSIFAESPIGIILYRPDGTFLSMNKACMAIFGIADVARARAINLFNGPLVPENAREMLQQGKTLRWDGLFDFDLVKQSGLYQPAKAGPLYIEVSITPLGLEGKGSLTGYLVQVQDITERKQAEEALRQSEQLYRLLAENITDVIYCTDMNGRPTYMSPSVTRLLGYSVEEAMSRTMEEGLTPASRDTAMKDLATEMALDYKEGQSGARVRRRELEFYRKDGSTVWAEVTVSFQRDAEGRPIAILGVMRDITERKRDEEELREAMLKLSRSNAELERFTYIASHHLQEPLRQVTSYVQLLAQRLEGKIDSDASDFMAYAVEGAHRMHRLINDFLAYSRLGLHSKAFKPVDCEAVLYEVLGILRGAIEETSAAITHGALPTIMADGEQLTQLFMQLLSNAIKFRSDEPPEVHIWAEESESECVFSVRDNGIGIAPEFFDKIFLVFHRLHSPTKYSGTGIGLAICKKVIDYHGGRIWVESEPGKGSTFHFAIPKRGEVQS